ncbi:uncharacterized protein LOC109199602 [Oreochromis niloticus]|uniref:uncharacterized protein LOC109199602 n=1 Tax=Oreochromis niloticus TaxID=8128 RepID=UPI000DF36199|nr:uncharacterized protein LOC109199602 [Oreochromis niloticus]
MKETSVLCLLFLISLLSCTMTQGNTTTSTITPPPPLSPPAIVVLSFFTSSTMTVLLVLLVLLVRRYIYRKLEDQDKAEEDDIKDDIKDDIIYSDIRISQRQQQPINQSRDSDSAPIDSEVRTEGVTYGEILVKGQKITLPCCDAETNPTSETDHSPESAIQNNNIADVEAKQLQTEVSGCLNDEERPASPSNISMEERKSLTSLSNDNSMIILPADTDFKPEPDVVYSSLK